MNWQKYGLIEAEYQAIVEQLQREPNELELALFGVMWSEHCSYKHTRNLLKNLPTSGELVVQGPGENAGVIKAGENLGIAFKIESHNHPSAVEPYQGAATGVGGIVRDVFSMGARPVAILDSLRFGDPSQERTRYLLKGVVSGIAGYGNCLGIPTVGGEVYFDDCYTKNPLVNAMCIGLVPLDRLKKGTAAGPGNQVLLVGARTGRDGIAGAAFASTELAEDTDADRPAVQVGDPFTEKLLLEACLELADNPYIIGVQDLGAAGITSSACEMAFRGECGLDLELSRVPVREENMTPVELMLSESQERMLVVVTPEGVEAVQAVFARWGLEAEAIGTVIDGGDMVLRMHGDVVGRVPAAALADGVPRRNPPVKRPQWLVQADEDGARNLPEADYNKELLNLLGSANICSRAPVFRQYDHMVGTNTVQAPGLSAAVLRIPGSTQGIVAATDCNSRYCQLDPREGARRAVAEAARNVACTGAKPAAVTNCLNFASPENPEHYWTLTEAISGMADACRALDTPVVGGNVSLYNESGGTAIFPTPVIGMVGLTADINKTSTIIPAAGQQLLLVGNLQPRLGGSEYLYNKLGRLTGPIPKVDLELESRLCNFLPQAIADGLVAAAHDVSEGGIAVTLAEMAISGKVGMSVEIPVGVRPDCWLFAESPGAVVVAVERESLPGLQSMVAEHNLPVRILGTVGGNHLQIGNQVNLSVGELATAWHSPLEAVFGQ
ncbi:MAG: phosphoribosylformylglycinamidine synthase subunit PurL [Firmicutes bacterium]|nr:phosphoribosylformylglycinamidine synthase subunit PurL [Bacillota bacterium]